MNSSCFVPEAQEESCKTLKCPFRKIKLSENLVFYEETARGLRSTYRPEHNTVPIETICMPGKKDKIEKYKNYTHTHQHVHTFDKNLSIMFAFEAVRVFYPSV
jgi:hypothetical protein